MIETAHLVTSIFEAANSDRLQPDIGSLIDELLRNLHELADMPGHPEKVIIQHRSMADGFPRAAKNDYRLLFRPLVLDNIIAAGVIKRLGVRMAYLAGRLGKAFGVLADLGVRHMAIGLPQTGGIENREIRIALHLVSVFLNKRHDGSEIHFTVDNETVRAPVIRYPRGLPHIGLTLLAFTNGLGQSEFAKLLESKLDEQGNDAISANDLYESILADPYFKRPCLEIRLAASFQGEIAGKKDEQQSSSALAGRLQLMSGMIRAAKERPDSRTILPVLIDKIRHELERLDIDELDCIEIQRQGLYIRQSEKHILVGMVDKHLFELLEIVKEKVEAGRKISAIESCGLSFVPSDCRHLARQFNMAEEEVRKILGLLGTCYDAKRRFLRAEFEHKIDQFVKYDKKIFEFLWGFLKNTENRVDRLGFLNALQKVVLKLNRPKQLLKFLLADVCSNPRQVQYSDRNALMLANGLLRTYNKDLDTDIEFTPDEVMLVKKGIDREVVQYARWRLELDYSRICAKMNTVHGGIELQLLQSKILTLPPLHFLMALEREFIIFLSLVAGGPANSVLLDIINSYGDPSHSIYNKGLGYKYLSDLMQQLKIAVRGLCRIGSAPEAEAIKKVMKKTAGFLSIPEATPCLGEIENTIGWIKKSIDGINRRLDGDYKRAK